MNKYLMKGDPSVRRAQYAPEQVCILVQADVLGVPVCVKSRRIARHFPAQLRVLTQRQNILRKLAAISRV